MPAQSMKNLPKNITHQTKRNINSTKQAQNQPSQAKTKQMTAKARKQSSSSCKAEQTLPRTEQVDDLIIKPAISSHKFSSSLHGGMLCELSPGQQSAQKYVTARRVLSPRTGISVAKINLTGVDHSESKKHDLSELESPSQFLSHQQLDESNQMLASSKSSINVQFQTHH